MNRNFLGVGGHHIVPLVAPASVSNAKVTSDNIKLDNTRHVSFLLHFGAMTADLDADLTVIASTAATPGTNDTTLANIKFRKMTTSDVWSALAEVSDSKLDIVAGGDITLVAGQLVLIELETSDIKGLSDTVDLNYVRFEIAAGGAYAYLLSADAILHPARYSGNIPATAIA
jgi:hypothetical protein